VPVLSLQSVYAVGEPSAAGGRRRAVSGPAAGTPGRWWLLAAPGARGRPPRQQADRGRARRTAGRAGAPLVRPAPLPAAAATRRRRARRPVGMARGPLRRPGTRRLLR